jgi:hypothetical protein
MIPYDDLVAALAAWRARQGLPVVQVAGAVPAAARPPAPPAAPRTAPPNAPPRSVAPAPLPSDDFGADALVEDAAYDVSGEDYVLSLASGVIVESAESTAIGGPPEPVDEGVLVPKRGKRKPDW